MKADQIFLAETSIKTIFYKISSAAVFNLLIIIAITAFIIQKPAKAGMKILSDKQTQQITVQTNIGPAKQNFQKTDSQISRLNPKNKLNITAIIDTENESNQQADIISDNEFFSSHARVIPLGSVAKDIKVTPADSYDLFSIELILQNVTNRVDTTHVIQAWDEDRIDFTTIYPLP